MNKITKTGNTSIICQVCKQHKKQSEVLPGSFVRNPIVGMIQKALPDWNPDGYICLTDLNRFRAEYVQSVIEQDKGELSSLEKQVVESLKEQDLITRNLNSEYEQQLTFGQKLADKIADFGGSWLFIMIFALVLVSWVIINSITLITKPFDPYPFIFLNLILSCLAAIQAPVIMMSQNRQEERDRIHAEHDYQVNLKAEIEIRHLHEKMDHLLTNQWQRLLEIQEVQMELMEEIAQQKKRKD
jgi:uncharacterized membrane protein